MNFQKTIVEVVVNLNTMWLLLGKLTIGTDCKLYNIQLYNSTVHCLKFSNFTISSISQRTKASDNSMDNKNSFFYISSVKDTNKPGIRSNRELLLVDGCIVDSR